MLGQISSSHSCSFSFSTSPAKISRCHTTRSPQMHEQTVPPGGNEVVPAVVVVVADVLDAATADRATAAPAAVGCHTCGLSATPTPNLSQPGLGEPVVPPDGAAALTTAAAGTCGRCGEGVAASAERSPPSPPPPPLTPLCVFSALHGLLTQTAAKAMLMRRRAGHRCRIQRGCREEAPRPTPFYRGRGGDVGCRPF